MLEIGSTITCYDLDDLIVTMTELARAGVETDWDPAELKQEKYILHVTAIEEGEA